MYPNLLESCKLFLFSGRVCFDRVGGDGDGSSGGTYFFPALIICRIELCIFIIFSKC